MMREHALRLVGETLVRDCLNMVHAARMELGPFRACDRAWRCVHKPAAFQ